MICSICKQEIVHPKDKIDTGYGLDDDGNKVCYPCCAEEDKQWLRENDRITLYLTNAQGGGLEIGNWPGSLKIPVEFYTIKNHNWSRIQTFAYFQFEDAWWLARQVGDISDLAHCRKLKHPPKGWN